MPTLPLEWSKQSDGYKNATAPFLHGVASGDPQDDRVVLWTRVTRDALAPTQVIVTWSVAEDIAFQRVVVTGVTRTDARTDFTIKVDPDGLQPDTTYYYRFHALGHDSSIGRTKTLPTKHAERLRIAAVSNANLRYGYFNAYGALARRRDLDAVIHMGDYLDEAINDLVDDTVVRHDQRPVEECVTLADFRKRHAAQNTDVDLQAAHRQNPFICMWDDHKVIRWNRRTQQHSFDAGDRNYLESRRAAATQAYFEWMPIRARLHENSNTIYRTFRFGELLDLILLDTRLLGREQKVVDRSIGAFNMDPNRQLLGEAQERWLVEELEDSAEHGTCWRLIAQQMMFAQLVNGACIFSPEQWDSYPAARVRMLDKLANNRIGNVAMLTANSHSSCGSDLVADPFDSNAYNPSTGKGSLAVEFAVPAVASPRIGNPLQVATLADVLRRGHPHLKFVELSGRGYAMLDITPARLQCEWYHMTRTDVRGASERCAAMLQVNDGENHLRISTEASLPRANAPGLAPVASSSAVDA